MNVIKILLTLFCINAFAEQVYVKNTNDKSNIKYNNVEKDTDCNDLDILLDSEVQKEEDTGGVEEQIVEGDKIDIEEITANNKIIKPDDFLKLYEVEGNTNTSYQINNNNSRRDYDELFKKNDKKADKSKSPVKVLKANTNISLNKKTITQAALILNTSNVLLPSISFNVYSKASRGVISTLKVVMNPLFFYNAKYSYNQYKELNSYQSSQVQDILNMNKIKTLFDSGKIISLVFNTKKILIKKFISYGVKLDFLTLSWLSLNISINPENKPFKTLSYSSEISFFLMLRALKNFKTKVSINFKFIDLVLFRLTPKLDDKSSYDKSHNDYFFKEVKEHDPSLFIKVLFIYKFKKNNIFIDLNLSLVSASFSFKGYIKSKSFVEKILSLKKIKNKYRKNKTEFL